MEFQWFLLLVHCILVHGHTSVYYQFFMEIEEFIVHDKIYVVAIGISIPECIKLTNGSTHTYIGICTTQSNGIDDYIRGNYSNDWFLTIRILSS